MTSERAHCVPQRRSRRVPFRSVEAGAFRSVSALWRKLHIHFPASPYRITTTSLGRDARGGKAPHPFPRSSFSSRNHFVGLRLELSPPAGGEGRSRRMRVFPPRCVPHATSSVTATPCHLPLKGKALGALRTAAKRTILHRGARTACVRARRRPSQDIGMSGDPIVPRRFHLQGQSLGVSKGGPTSPFGVSFFQAPPGFFLHEQKEMGWNRTRDGVGTSDAPPHYCFFHMPVVK